MGNSIVTEATTRRRLARTSAAVLALLILPWGVLWAAGEASTKPSGAPNATAQHGPDDQVFIFSYFWEPDGVGGLRLATSEDLFHWTEIPGPHLIPKVGGTTQKGTRDYKVMRDPYLERGPDGVFRMTWTTAWGGRDDIGYASSRDLVTWTDEKAIPVMKSKPAVENCWAPKLFYDADKAQWIVSWGSTLGDNTFPKSPVLGTTRNHRIWHVTTKDFETFSEPQVYFDPGYSCIDAALLKDGGDYYLFFKDERANDAPESDLNPQYQNIRMAHATSPYGPFGDISEPITGQGPGKWENEGPTPIKLGEWTYVFYDHHGGDVYFGAVRTRDYKTWEDVSDQFRMPRGAKHGHILRVPRSVVENLVARKSAK